MAARGQSWYGSLIRLGWNQQVALATWTIAHNLQRYPSITVTDNSGRVVAPDISYVDGNIIQITHSSPLTGWAYLN